ncbi:glycoside hydrolase family 88 protein [Psychrobacter okhotskensis]|uniref:glycoside hydrolase family 88 protein n=1 Tax=Psychrobacter okhotskensis TaxID=212403 RepID=UPI00191894C4|nr:glycoside hydrolase family 88 protein [Psychrobacter okhotskensis]
MAKINSNIRNDILELDKIISDASLEMLKSKRTFMSFNDEDSLYVKLARVKAWLKRDNRHQKYAYFNFPLAFLLLGVIDKYKQSGERSFLNSVENKCSELVSKSGKLLFTFDKVDQATFGLVFLELYKITNSNKYLTACDEIYKNILTFIGKDGIIRYRKGINVAFIDTIGLVCPFLVMYKNVAGCEEALIIAERQIKNIINVGLDKNGIQPFHAVDLTLNAPLGSINWGRGIGWWLLGLAPFAAMSSQDDPNEYLLHFSKLFRFLENAQSTEGYWSQFIGHTNDNTIDASATLIFLFAAQQAGLKKIKTQDIFTLIGKCVDNRGIVLGSSGDTIYINKYSRAKGASELSQGMMLSLISKVSL